MPTSPSDRRWLDAFLAWYFVTVWGTGFLATKIGLQYAAPFTFLALRFVLGLALMVPVVLLLRPRWPASPAELGHVAVAGVLMHAVGLEFLMFEVVPTALSLAGIAITCLGVALVAWRSRDPAHAEP